MSDMASLDTIFDLMSEERRRYVLYYLEQQSDAVPVSDVAEQVAAWENNPDSAPGGLDQYYGLQVDLMHNHLPKAAELAYIEYDPDEQTVELTGSDQKYRAILKVAKRLERPDDS